MCHILNSSAMYSTRGNIVLISVKKLIGMGRKQTLAPYLSLRVIMELDALCGVSSLELNKKKIFPINIQGSELRLLFFVF